MQRNDLLVWMDLEMTSLKNVLTDRIIEIAVVLTDKDLNVVAEGPDIVIHADQALFDLDPFVRSLHEGSGMLAASLASTVTLEQAEQQMLEFVQKHVAKQSSPLCGNSIHTDRHFLRIQMPTLEDYLFYRCIDVSTLKELAKRWAPEVYAEAERRKANKVHRAKNDILQSIDELRFYRKELFKA
jgi:oligoribonuclease